MTPKVTHARVRFATTSGKVYVTSKVTHALVYTCYASPDVLHVLHFTEGVTCTTFGVTYAQHVLHVRVSEGDACALGEGNSRASPEVVRVMHVRAKQYIVLHCIASALFQCI